MFPSLPTLQTLPTPSSSTPPVITLKNPPTREEILQIESPLRKLLTSVRQSLISKQILGTIEIDVVQAFFTHSLSVEITEDDLNNNETESVTPTNDLFQSDQQLPNIGFFRAALPSVDGAIERMILRSLEWRETSFVDSLQMSDGFSISDPVVGAFGLSFSISAKVSSLLAYAEQHPNRV